MAYDPSNPWGETPEQIAARQKNQADIAAWYAQNNVSQNTSTPFNFTETAPGVTPYTGANPGAASFGVTSGPQNYTTTPSYLTAQPGTGAAFQGAGAPSEVTKPLQVGGGTMYAGGSNNGVENAQNLPGYMGSAGGSQGWGTGSTGANPYLTDITNSLDATRKFALEGDLGRIRGSSNMAGQTGSLKQGALEGTAIGLSNQGYSGAVANLLGTDWTNQQNRNLQDDAQRNSFNLGNRQLDQSGARLGADLFTGGMNGEWSPLNNANSIYGNYTGYGTTTNNQSSGGGWQGALGGILGAGNFANQMGWWK
jgi:hypothetical protein